MKRKAKKEPAAVTCPHPKCSGPAVKTCTLGSTDHYQCQKCGFSFPNTGAHR